MDEACEFQAPREVVSARFGGGENHLHTNMAHLTATPTTDPMVPVREWDVDAEGRKELSKARLTVCPPLDFAKEYLERPFTDSKEFEHYVPRGDRTQIVVVGDYRSLTIPRTQLRSIVTGALHAASENDVANLRRRKESLRVSAPPPPASPPA